MQYSEEAQKPRVAMWATECEDFLTPWYTYAARALMLPLGALSLYFIYWRWYVLPLSSIVLLCDAVTTQHTRTACLTCIASSRLLCVSSAQNSAAATAR
jgi:hypothetical protein